MDRTCGASRSKTRKATLASLLRGSLPGLRLNEHLAHPGDLVFRHACKMGLEGIMSDAHVCSPVIRSGKAG
jgi:ATP-dependent DNA ligase